MGTLQLYVNIHNGYKLRLLICLMQLHLVLWRGGEVHVVRSPEAMRRGPRGVAILGRVSMRPGAWLFGASEQRRGPRGQVARGHMADRVVSPGGRVSVRPGARLVGARREAHYLNTAAVRVINFFFFFFTCDAGFLNSLCRSLENSKARGCNGEAMAASTSV